MFTIRSVSTRKISRIGKQCFRGPDSFFFEIRSELHKLEQAMLLAVKSAGTLVLPGPAFPRFRLMGVAPIPLRQSLRLWLRTEIGASCKQAPAEIQRVPVVWVDKKRSSYDFSSCLFQPITSSAFLGKM